MDIKQIARKIVHVMECGADFAVKQNDPKCCELFLVTLPDNLSEIQEATHIGCVSAPVQIFGELVRLNLRFTNFTSLATPIRDAICVALEPYLMSRRLHLIVHDTLEGLEFVLVNDGKIQAFHDGASEKEMAP
jgi:hypothetical protein